MCDMHVRKDLKLALPSGVSYIGGLDAVTAPWGLVKAGAVSDMRVSYVHKQVSVQEQVLQEAHAGEYQVASI